MRDKYYTFTTKRHLISYLDMVAEKMGVSRSAIIRLLSGISDSKGDDKSKRGRNESTKHS